MGESSPTMAGEEESGLVTSLDIIDKRILNLLQDDFPLVPRPFAALAAKLGIDEEELLERARRLRKMGVLRHLSAIFDVFRVGYKSSLIAMAVPPETIDQSAAVISAHPGVSHNYGRDHHFNLWFVLAIPGEQDYEGTVSTLGEAAGASRTLILPARRLFKIDVRYDMVEGEGRSSEGANQRNLGPRRDLTAGEKALVRVLQEDLPLVSRPFAELALSLGLGEEELIERARALLEEGIMRRFAGVLRHQEAGFMANGMACWVVPEERIEEVGRVLAASPRVSHCYWRPTYPDWPYPLFAMVHSRTREQCESIVADLSEQTGISEYVVLFSTREYKKERVKYFVEQPAGALST